mmetsp:Transcript_22850/g.64680  ORF Transcript_22850/g.64680 Transcript_22850/m.64680 type:complete len:297 (-) Transcript_22850:165-1055(-)
MRKPSVETIQSWVRDDAQPCEKTNSNSRMSSVPQRQRCLCVPALFHHGLGCLCRTRTGSLERITQNGNTCTSNQPTNQPDEQAMPHKRNGPMRRNESMQMHVHEYTRMPCMHLRHRRAGADGWVVSHRPRVFSNDDLVELDSRVLRFPRFGSVLPLERLVQRLRLHDAPDVAPCEREGVASSHAGPGESTGQSASARSATFRLGYRRRTFRTSAVIRKRVRLCLLHPFPQAPRSCECVLHFLMFTSVHLAPPALMAGRMLSFPIPYSCALPPHAGDYGCRLLLVAFVVVVVVFCCR